jgi:hypothetical protein
MYTMRFDARVPVALLGGLAALSFTLPAGAGTRTTTNACLYSVNNEYRDQLVTLGGAGSPREAAAGAPVTLSGTYISATLPPSLPKTGYDLGIFKAGHNSIPSRVWLAIAAAHATPPTQVREVSVTASTTIRIGAGGNFVSGTPIVVRIPIPDTLWTATGEGPVSFSQAAAGSLPSLPVGINDTLVPVAGSILVKPKLANLRFLMDCQPGSTAAPYKSLTPALASPFATLEVDSPLPAATAATRAASVASTKLKRAGSRVAVAIACPAGASACKGRITLRSVAPVRLAGRSQTRVVALGAAYNVPAGARRTVRLTLSRVARTLLRTRRTLRVRATLSPATGKAVKRDLTLHR